VTSFIDSLCSPAVGLSNAAFEGDSLMDELAAFRRVSRFGSWTGLFQDGFVFDCCCLVGLCLEVGEVMSLSTAASASLVRKVAPSVAWKLRALRGGL
jgi:hypothetical protein